MHTYVSASKFNPSGTYIEQGTEIFVGCMGTRCGTFETTYHFTAKFKDDVVNLKYDYRGHISFK